MAQQPQETKSKGRPDPNLWSPVKELLSPPLPKTPKWSKLSVKDKLAYWNTRLKVIAKRESAGMSCTREKARVNKRIDELKGAGKREKKVEEEAQE